jgi:hypothetical protein
MTVKKTSEQQKSTQGKASKIGTERDVFVISGGSNDIDINYEKTSDVLSKMVKFIQLFNNSKIIIMSIPYRHDLEENARINLAIKKLNKKLKDITQRFRHVIIINSDINRTYFTRHGMHLNNRGKAKLAKEIANLINKFYLEENIDKSVITIKGRDEKYRSKTTQKTTDQTPNNTLERNDKIPYRISTRPKKPPITRNEDFLWPRL